MTGASEETTLEQTTGLHMTSWECWIRIPRMMGSHRRFGAEGGRADLHFTGWPLGYMRMRGEQQGGETVTPERSQGDELGSRCSSSGWGSWWLRYCGNYSFAILANSVTLSLMNLLDLFIFYFEIQLLKPHKLGMRANLQNKMIYPEIYETSIIVFPCS